MPAADRSAGLSTSYSVSGALQPAGSSCCATSIPPYKVVPCRCPGGQYVVELGECAITNGLPYTSLATMFKERSVVYLELKVNTDPPMTPRIRIVSAAYSLNADNLDGKDSRRIPRYLRDGADEGGPCIWRAGIGTWTVPTATSSSGTAVTA